MKDQLRSILHTSWNEPRHFFFWLAMLSVCCFAAVALGLALIGPNLLLGFAALGSILCFVLSVPAFILAWIPPVRRLFEWLLHRRWLALGCVVSLIALFYAVENWRGRQAWQNYKKTWEAKGERFDLASYIPPPVPADQNFFETPLWSDLHFTDTNGTILWSSTNHGKAVLFDAFGPDRGKAPSEGGWPLGRRVDLAAWQAYYRSTNNLFAAPGGTPTNYFPVAKEPQTPAADVLLALSKFEGNRQLLIATAARPKARFWAKYDSGFAMLLPHLSRARAISQYLSLHAVAALRDGDRNTALEDVKLMFRLLAAIRQEPTLISQLVRMAVLKSALQPVWEGLADHLWRDADVSVIQDELGKLDFLADYHLAMRGERGCELWAMNYLRKAGLQGLVEMGLSGGSAGQTDWGKSLGQAVFRLIPSGWFDQNKLSICRLQDQYLISLVPPGDRRLAPPEVFRAADSALWQRWRPYNMFGRMLLPALGRAAERFAQAQTTANLARVACALERYRLANGQFPESLRALVPKFIEQVPPDVMNGQPLKYRRTDDGQFVLYSVGRDRTDDGGKIELTKGGSLDWRHGDWVWRYTAE